MVATQVISIQVSERNMGSSDALIENPVTIEFQFDVVSWRERDRERERDQVAGEKPKLVVIG